MLYLKPSPLHGVGVFTTTPIPKGTELDLFLPHESVSRKRLPSGVRGRYCTKRKGGGWWVPRDPNHMSIGWYLNHSYERSNLESITFKTTRYIRAGEELLLDTYYNDGGEE